MSDADCRYMLNDILKQLHDLILQAGHLKARLRGMETQLEACIDLHEMAHPKKENQNENNAWRDDSDAGL